ncbi:hypothetical protein CMI37_03175 [Candidatus Pacearchaeota archaeon]|nr:hypothetical protein [Candidatus Pacearchaeota archaeon]|tara:strand:+ start:642 stop:1508 length:867 start_codon:yes stop_codon:yes gene_type:complete
MADKVGWTFGNQPVPEGGWGEVLSPDDMRYTYLYGVDLTANDLEETPWSDEQFRFFVRSAVADFEKFLTIDIRRRVYKTNPVATLIRSKEWTTGVDYTDREDPYPFQPELWSNFGFVQLRHMPIISVERAKLYSQVKTEVIDLLGQNWVRLQKHTGQVNLFPTGGIAYGPFSVGIMPWRILGARFTQGMEWDYTTGYETSEFVDDDLREVVGKYAAIKCLASIGDGLLAGFSSSSVSLDGLSESFSSTQSATSAYFGARIKQYTEDIKDWLERNRNKFGAIPLEFVGA